MATADIRKPSRFRLQLWALPMILLALIGLLFFVLTLVSNIAIVLWVGIPLTLVLTGLVRGHANLHRWWVGRVTGVPVPRPYRTRPRGTRGGRLRTVLTDPATWRDLAWLPLNGIIGTFLCLFSLLLFLLVPWYLVALPILWRVVPNNIFALDWGVIYADATHNALLAPALAGVAFLLWLLLGRPILLGYVRLNRWLLSPGKKARLASRVAQLTEVRDETVDTQAAEVRRIERDLHDGAQARLVALGMSLGMAEEMLASDPQAAQRMLAEARASTSTALSELRDLVRGIHPPVLADRGLDGAVRALALNSALRVEVDIELDGRPPAPVESAAYFAVAETLTNAAKHAGTPTATVRARHTDGVLHITVRDDGHGGAAPSRAGGLHGIERRLAAFDGSMSVDSPPGGPTVVTMEVPCALSSAKTSPATETG